MSKNNVDSPVSTERDAAGPAAKPVFLKPQLEHHGSLVDLTNPFGGSLTPNERAALGLDDY